jgi:hypothetical protein
MSNAKYETTNRIVEIAESPKSVATWISARPLPLPRDDICRTPLALGQTHPLARNEFGIAGTSHGPAPFRVTSSGTSNTDARTVAHMTHPYAAM